MPAIPANTKLLLHMDGADASTTFTDSSGLGKTVTAVGNAQIDTAQFVFGGASGLFDGTGDYLTTADSDDWNLGSGDFTFRTRVRYNAAPSGARFFEQRVDDNNRVLLYHSGANVQFIVFSGGSLTHNLAFAWTPSTGVWYDFTFVRTGNDYMCFIDGTQVGSTATDADALPNLAAPLLIGAGDGGTGGFINGWYDELIWVKGTALYTADFTPPSVPYGTDDPVTSGGSKRTLLGVGS